MSRVLSSGLLAALLGLSTLSCGGEEGGVRIVLITLDTLRWDSFAPPEGAQASMPKLEAWARDAAVFERYYSATSTTQPTHATLFTGLHPWKHGVPFNGATLVDEHETVAERLLAQGFYTAAAIASFPVHSQFGFDQGFVEYRDEFTKGEVDMWSGVEVEAEGFHSDAGDVVKQAFELIDGGQGDRQFYWFHFYDPHAPYGDSGKGKQTLNPRSIIDDIEEGGDPAEVCAQARTAYDKDVKYLDRALARLLERLEQDGELWETHVVIVSDHGESFGEQTSLGHGKRLTPEQIHVPLIVHSPRVAAGARTEPVGTIDVTAALYSLAGLSELPAGARDLTGDVSGGVVMGMRRTFNKPYRESRTDGTFRIIRPDDRRFFLVDEGVMYTGNADGITIEDQGPEVNDERAKQHRELFAAFEQDFNAVGFEVTDDEHTLDVLEQLGYTQ
jgi:arylsulfatase A-like enzyme